MANNFYCLYSAAGVAKCLQFSDFADRGSGAIELQSASHNLQKRLETQAFPAPQAKCAAAARLT
jgi:hypothetical protein